MKVAAALQLAVRTKRSLRNADGRPRLCRYREGATPDKERTDLRAIRAIAYIKLAWDPPCVPAHPVYRCKPVCVRPPCRDRKSTRLNSSHLVISYAVFCLKKKK